jgi:hypothetical protein
LVSFVLSSLLKQCAIERYSDIQHQKIALRFKHFIVGNTTLICVVAVSIVSRKPNPDTNQGTGAAYGLMLITLLLWMSHLTSGIIIFNRIY